MIDIEPPALEFRDVRLNQAYTTSLCLTNPLSGAVDISLKPSSPRYSVSPARITLSPGQSVVITVRLYVAHFPNYSKGIQGHQDFISIKSLYFEQKVDVTLFLRKRDVPSRSLSPQRSSLLDASSKDTTIQETDRLLEEKYPDLEHVLQERLSVERQVFEEKSEKILRILRAKDEQIADLEQQLKSQSRLQRSEAPPPPPQPDTALLTLRKKLSDALKLNETLKQQLNAAEKQIETLKTTDSEESTRIMSRLQEKVLDQAEQIEVLVQEITQLQAGEAPSSQLLTKHKQELAAMQHHIYALRQEIDRLQNELAQRPSRVREGAASVATQSDIESDSNVRAGYTDYRQTTLEPTELDRASALYKERAEYAEKALNTLQQQYDLLLQREQEANLKWHESQQHWEEIAERQAEIRMKEEALLEKEQHLTDREKTLHHMLGSVSERPSGDGGNHEGSLPDAHAWWAYVYHEMKRQHPDDVLQHDSDDEEEKQNSLVEQQKNTIRSQALEVATLRQDILMKNMKYKQQLETLKDENAKYQRDNFKLHSYISAHRGDREIKINELQTTIRLMSSRSDLHQALAAARQELEDEKLVVHHLRSDIDAYRSLLEEEHNKIAELRKTLQITQNELNASEIAKSIITVPGANAVTLIELFSGRLMYLQEEIARLQSSTVTGSQRKNWKSNVRNIAERGDGIDADGDDYDREINVLLSNATPDTLPDVLDAVLLARKVQQLTFMLDEQKIALQAAASENNELRQQLQDVQGPEYDAWHKYNDRLLIQRNEYEKRYEICHCKFEEAIHDLELARKRMSELEIEVRDLNEQISTNFRAEARDAPLLSDDSVASNENDDINDLELKEVKALLRERTVQLKVLMETLDVLQLGGMKNGMLNMNAQELAEELSGQWERGGDVWGLQALVKRVVDLTAEVGSNTSTIHALKKQVKEVEIEKSRALHEYHQVLNARKAADDAVTAMEIKLQSMSEELRTQARMNAEEISELRKQCNVLQEKLRESEAAYRESLVRCDSLKAQTDVNDATALEKCIAELFCDHQTLQFHEIRSDREDVKQLIVTLLVQWRDQVGFYPRAAAGPISKAEQKFLNRITKLVLEAHDRCHQMEIKLSEVENKQALSDARYLLSRKLLESSVSVLHRYRCRVDAAERISSVDELYLRRCQARTDTLLKKEIASLRDKLSRCNGEIIIERRRYAELAAKFTSSEAISKKLKAQLVQIESNMRNPKNAGDMSNIDEKLRAFELQLHKWFKVELPRLISGVPVEEDQYRSYHRGTDATPLAQQLGIEKTYALSQALCSAKTERAMLESKLQSSRELVSYYKERVMCLENVIYRWRSEFDEKDEDILSAIPESQLSAPRASHQLTPQLEEENQRLVSRVRDLEEKLVETTSQFEHVKERSDALKQVVDTLRQENIEAKQEHVMHLNQMRHELSEKYIAELRDIREAYEMEKGALAAELQKFAEEIHSADVPEVVHRILSESTPSTPQSTYGMYPSHSVDAPPPPFARAATVSDTRSSSTSHSQPSSHSSLHHFEAPAPTTKLAATVTQAADANRAESSPASSSSQSADSMDEVLPHEAGLWTRVAGGPSSSQPPAPQPASNAPAIERPAHEELVNQLRQRVETLAVDVQRERQVASVAQQQVKELEELLEKQREAFRHHLVMERDVAMLSASTSQLDVTRRTDEYSVSTGSSDSRSQQAQIPVHTSPSMVHELSSMMNDLDAVLAISQTDWPAKRQHVASCVGKCSDILRRVIHAPPTPVDIRQTQRGDTAKIGYMDRATSPLYALQQGSSPVTGSIRENIHALERSLSQEYRDADLRVLRELQERIALLESQEHVNPVHESYEKALREAQDALDHQIEVSREQCEQLTHALDKERNRANSISEQLQYAMQENERLQKQATASDSSLEGVVKMQQLLANVTDELDASKKASKVLQTQYESKLQHLQKHFEKFQATHAEIVESLESQLKQAQEKSISEIRQSLEKNVGVSDEQIELAILSMKIQSKRTELNAVLQALVTVGSSYEKSQESNAQDNDARVREAMMQARLNAADKELELMSRELAKERNALLALKAEIEQEKAGVASEEPAGDPNDKLKSLARRANNMRRQYVNEIDGLKAQLSTLKESEAALKAETTKLKAMIIEYKDQISVLREDNARKAKLVSALKANKSSEANAVEQYRNENNELDEKCKRLQRALLSKEEIIKDLKNKQHVAASAADLDQEGDGGDISSLTPLDMRKRIKSLELERGRLRARLTACKEKIEELESSQKQAVAEEAQSSQLNEKIEHLKLTLSRKEILIKSYKEQIDKMKVEILAQKEIYESHRSDFEKQIRSLQRQVDFGEKRYHDFASEYEKMKERLTSNYEDAEEKSAKLKQVLEVTLDELDRRTEEQPPRPMKGVDVSDISLRSSGTPVSHDELEDIMSALRTSKEDKRSTSTRRPQGADLEGRIAQLLDLSSSSRSSSGKSGKSDDTSAIERRLKKMVSSALEQK